MRKEYKIALKALAYTVVAVVVTIWGLFSVFMEIFNGDTPEAESMYMILAFFIMTLFTIIICTLTILDKLEDKDKKDSAASNV